MKFNTDVFVSRNGLFASIRRVIQDADTIWVCDFSMLMGKETLFKFEVRVVLEGLLLAWEKGLRQIELECSNALLMEFQLIGGAANSLMAKIRLLFCRVHYTVRAHNEVANHMVNLTNSGFMSLYVFDEPLLSIKKLLLAYCNNSL